MNNILKVLILISLSQGLWANEHHAHEEWEIGISAGYANLKTENEEGANLHFHLMKRLGDEGLQQYFSVGFGAEVIVTDEEHYGAMLTLAVHPLEDFTFSVSPGFEWENHEGHGWERVYATHLEMTYSFDVSEHYHLGPVVGYSKTKEVEHYTVGVHLGFPF